MLDFVKVTGYYLVAVTDILVGFKVFEEVRACSRIYDLCNHYLRI